MKKSLFIILVLAISQIVFANPNYKNGNGTILSSSEKDGAKSIIRKCEIDDVKIGPSPQWMRHRLISCGINPINNIR